MHGAVSAIMQTICCVSGGIYRLAIFKTKLANDSERTRTVLYNFAFRQQVVDYTHFVESLSLRIGYAKAVLVEDPNRYLVEISQLSSEICVGLDLSRVANVSTEHLKHFNSIIASISICELVRGPCCATQLLVMQSSNYEQLSDDSGAGKDPHQSIAAPNSLSQLQNVYVSCSDEFVPGTPDKEFDDEERQSDCSDLHTPAQPSTRWRLSSASPVKWGQVAVSELDSDGVDRDSLLVSH